MKMLPESTKVFDAYVVKSISPQHRWTSFALFSNVQSGFHTDVPSSLWPNLVRDPAGNFANGCIRVEWRQHALRDPALVYEENDLDNNDVLGPILPVAEGPVRFGAKHLRHSTCKFSG